MPDALTDFLEPFPAAVAAAAGRAAAEGAAIVAADPQLVEFRRHPHASLPIVSDRLEALWRFAPPPGRVIWCASGSASTGLDDFEVPAILGRRLDLDFVHQAAAGDEKRLLAVGTLRDEHVGLAFVVAGDQLAPLCAVLADAGVPAILFVRSADAATADAAATSSVRRVVAAGGSIGLFVPAAETAATMAAPESAVAPLAELAGRAIAMSRFAAPPIDQPAAFDRFMRQAGLVCDTSMPVDDGAGPPQLTIRNAAYAGASPYRPQPFDLRVPWFQAEAGMWFEMPAAPISEATLDAFWSGRRGASDERLAALLDSTRMEAFYRASRIAPAEEEHYPEFRIYNWPAPPPAARVTLLLGDQGPVVEMTQLAKTVLAFMQSAGPRVHLAGADGLLARARGEVAARYVISATRAIEAQNEAHEYLAAVPHEAPLRPDYADFTRFVAPELGDTLELGSGYGVLAWALSLRARRYTCLDLDRHMFRALRHDLGQAGVVADMHRLPFAPAAFDSVVANNVLEHLYDPLTGLQEIRRVLKPGGRVFALVPLDALNSRHALPAHLWKLDEPGVRSGFTAAGFAVARLEVVHLNELGVVGAFPTCHGLAAKVEAVNAAVDAWPTARAGRAPALRGLPGRLLPVVREVTRFEHWRDRRVVTMLSEPTDVDEFTHFGARVTTIDNATLPWAVRDGSADLVYGFLTLPTDSLPAIAAEIHRVLAPGGTVVAGFRNRQGLRYLARVRSYFGTACDVDALSGPDASAIVADDDGALRDTEYVERSRVESAFSSFSNVTMIVRGLTPEDVPGARQDDPRFWEWLSQSLGRFILVRATT